MASPTSRRLSQLQTQVDLQPVTSVGPALDSPSSPGSWASADPAKRYDGGALLGEGGMGEVRLIKDERIGREVAMKVIRPEHAVRADIRARFVREARVQGQLEHPAIVPVYDVGTRADGSAFFTMKRIRGMTFADVVDRARSGDEEALREHSLRKLLAAFGSVCLAVEFAHARGVIHRDLKPGNVMLGDFGEVYVLDWGIAKIVEEPDDAITLEIAAANMKAPLPVDSGQEVTTQGGVFLGTLGYASPEQFQNEDVDARSDVYSLGAILFEILTLRSLHEGAFMKMVETTLDGADARCSVRAPEREIAPELEAICVKATQQAPSGRHFSARALSEAIQKYLDGDRDAERRRELSTDYATSAFDALAKPESDAAQQTSARSLALTDLGRAVALDPSNEMAIDGIVSLLIEPPRARPAEVTASVEALRDDSKRQINDVGTVVFPLWLAVFAPIVWWMGLRVPLAGEVVCALAVTGFLGCLIQRHRRTIAMNYVVMLSAAIAFAIMSRIVGPLLLVPTLAMGTTMVFIMYPVVSVQRVAMIVMSLAIVVPFVLERFGILPASYEFRDGVMIVLPHVCDLPENATIALLAAGPILMLLMVSVGIQRIRQALSEAEEKLALQTWQLRQLVPERARRKIVA